MDSLQPFCLNQLVKCCPSHISLFNGLCSRYFAVSPILYRFIEAIIALSLWAAYTPFLIALTISKLPALCVDLTLIGADSTKNTYNKLASSTACIYLLFQRYKSNALFAEVFQRVKQIRQAPANPAEALKIDYITFTNIIKHCLKLWPVRIFAACLILNNTWDGLTIDNSCPFEGWL